MKEKFTLAGSNELESTENQDGNIAGFWRGLWHGLIVPFTFIISLFKENVGIYETHNNGNWYNFGFVLGLMIVLGGNSGVSKQLSSVKEA
jgi:hypothetical protein